MFIIFVKLNYVVCTFVVISSCFEGTIKLLSISNFQSPEKFERHFSSYNLKASYNSPVLFHSIEILIFFSILLSFIYLFYFVFLSILDVCFVYLCFRPLFPVMMNLFSLFEKNHSFSVYLLLFVQFILLICLLRSFSNCSHFI